MLRKKIYAVVAILALGGTAFAPMSAMASGRHGSGVHSNLTCIGQFGGRVLGGHICPLK
jgi:hypothetical protein